jgi:hypothetical protein
MGTMKAKSMAGNLEIRLVEHLEIQLAEQLEDTMDTMLGCMTVCCLDYYLVLWLEIESVQSRAMYLAETLVYSMAVESAV